MPAALEGFALERVVADSAFWWERVEQGYVPSGDSPEASARALQRWRSLHTTARGCDLDRRWHWQGVDRDAILGRLGTVSPPAGAAPPLWSETLEEIVENAGDRAFGDRAAGDDAESSPIDPDDPLPFEHLLLPAVLVARRRLAARGGGRGASSSLAPTAHRDLERSLLKRLARLSADALYTEFSRTRPGGLVFLALALPDRQDGGGRAHYEEFVRDQLRSGLRRLFSRYPVLGRLTAVAVDQWVDCCAELEERLGDDFDELVETFFGGAAPGAVDAVELDLSDRHRGGRTVFVLRFEGGHRLVYKPKSLGPDLVFARLQRWCNDQRTDGDELLDFRITRMLARQTYGWVEYIDQRPCPDEAAVRRFYRRAGQLLALIHAVRGTDCHQENLIAHGEHLVLIDHETLFFPEPRMLSGDRQDSASRLLGNSILTTGMLPEWEVNDGRLARDTSGFGGQDEQEYEVRLPVWKAINTDDMHRGRCTVSFPGRHRPELRGERLSVLDYSDEVIAGFRSGYRFVRRHRDELMAEGGPLSELSRQVVRFLFRRTMVYSVLLDRLTAAEYLRDGVTYSIELDLLSRAFLAEEERSHAWPVLAAELRAMAQMDIPLFFAEASSTTLRWDGEGALPGYLIRSSAERIRRNLAGLDERDQSWQLQVLESTFFTRRARKPVDQGREAAPSDDGAGIGNAELLQEAGALGAEIRGAAIPEDDGALRWIGLAFEPQVERYQLETLDQQLYHGAGGIAIFLASLARVTGDREYEGLALRALAPLRREIREPELVDRVTRRFGLGGISGTGSMIYALVFLARMLDEATLLEEALVLARVINRDQIREDRRLDVISGCGGALLALLALYETSRDPAMLARARWCGDHLVESRIETESGRAWPTLRSLPLLGFSHGAAGICHALLRLHGATGDERYLEAAEGGVAYERSLYCERAANWPDLRQRVADDDGAFMTSWCHGAPGIGLGRLGSLDVLDGEAIRRDIELALQATIAFGLGEIDTVCCGNFGRLDILLEAARRLERPELEELARTWARQTVARARRVGGYRALSNLPHAATPPGFFMGLSGVGYGLLRLLDDRLPSVLLLE